MKFALALLVAWLIIVVIIFGSVFGYFSASFFAFGPSPALYIIGINYYVDTWPRYIWISTYITVQNFIITFAGDNIYPWINAVILNRQQPDITMPKIEAFAITNTMYATFAILGLFSTGITMTQVDFWLYGFASTTLAGMIQSYRCIKNKRVVLAGMEQIEEIL